MLSVMKTRAGRADPASTMRRYRTDRFVKAPVVSGAAMRRVEEAMIAALPPGASEVALAPLVPFGSHAAVAGVDQNRIVSTVRGSEVAADPTFGLALELAQRRSELLASAPRDATAMTAIAFQRVVRAQRFEGPRSFAHFVLGGLVTAGRDVGDHGFETDSVTIHVRHAVSSLLGVGADGVTVVLSDFTGGRLGHVAERVEGLGVPGVNVVVDPDRTRARSYYTDYAIEVTARFGDVELEVGDGGLVDWSQKLLANGKERMMTSGLSVERIAMVVS